MIRSHMDHIVITAPSLDLGSEYVRQTLGVNLQVGGEHPRMGTHNCLLKLGEKCYLEAISINPNAPRPARPRWFQLDEPDPSQPIRLTTWVARTDDIHAAATASPIPLGEVEPMSRGQLNWLITLPADGSLPLHGIAPTLIQWTAGGHPAARLQESGCALVRLDGFHPEPRKVINMLGSIGFEGDFRVSELPPDQKPYLVAHIQTPAGMRQLSAPGFSLSPDARRPVSSALYFRYSGGGQVHMITRNLEIRRAGIFVLLCLSVIGAYPGQAQSTGTVNHPQNTFTGPCVGFYAHLLQNGPADSQGVYHAEWAGWAGYATFYVNYHSGWTYRITQSKPVSNGYQVCVKPADLKANFYSSITKDILRWTPKNQVSPACSQENADWTKAALDHENDHEKITRQYIEEKNRTWSPAGFQPEACGEGMTESEAGDKARAALEELINSRLQTEAEQLKEKIMKKQKAHDEAHPVRLINCSLCGAD